MATDRRAEATWQGSLIEGSGRIDSTTSGVLGSQPLTWKARAEDDPGSTTSPEDLIAAAHASCFAMALSNVLAKAGTPPDEVKTSATVTFQPGEGITKIALTVRVASPESTRTRSGRPPRMRSRTAPSRRHSRASARSRWTRG